jgi:hypothetical protein
MVLEHVDAFQYYAFMYYLRKVHKTNVHCGLFDDGGPHYKSSKFLYFNCTSQLTRR